ncbi:MAG: GNAT family N-acetyltransferase [Lysinibacillus sp.]
MEIRKGTIDDAELLWMLMQDAFSEYKEDVAPSTALQETPDFIRQEIKAGEQSFIIMNEEGEPAGMVRYKMTDDCLSFFRMSVRRSHQAKGYAKKLLIELEKEALQNRLAYIKCRVRSTSQRNMHLYIHLGYRQCGEDLLERNGVPITIALLEKPLSIMSNRQGM